MWYLSNKAYDIKYPVDLSSLFRTKFYSLFSDAQYMPMQHLQPVCYIFNGRTCLNHLDQRRLEKAPEDIQSGVLNEMI